MRQLTGTPKLDSNARSSTRKVKRKRRRVRKQLGLSWSLPIGMIRYSFQMTRKTSIMYKDCYHPILLASCKLVRKIHFKPALGVLMTSSTIWWIIVRTLFRFNSFTGYVHHLLKISILILTPWLMHELITYLFFLIDVKFVIPQLARRYPRLNSEPIYDQNMKSQWLPFAFTDVGLINGMLFIASHSLAALYNNDLYHLRALNYKVLCIHSTNMAISRKGDNISDLTIAKSLLLASDEVCALWILAICHGSRTLTT